MKKITGVCIGLLLGSTVTAQQPGKFKQLMEELPTPNVYRTASGAPGHRYYQQQADYKIRITLDDAAQTISGEEVITYHNNSPDVLTYLWVQLDQNVRAKDGMPARIQKNAMEESMNTWTYNRLHFDFDGGFKISAVEETGGRSLPFVINETMMRVDLPQPLRSGQKYSFRIRWSYKINDRMEIGGRSGYEYFPEDDNYLYTIAQFFPRMAVYADNTGWQNKQFLGMGEFTLPFGNYEVSITVPKDHVVAATGELQNEAEVLTAEQRKRLAQAAQSLEDPVMIVNEKEAREAEKNKAASTRTWVFRAENVRDFAFASSRKFIWDAMGVKIGGKTVMAMSYYPKEGNPLWEQYSTRVVAHTLRTYSKFTVNYPYPKAISVHSKHIGMEYPMICFNGGRPEPDGTYSEGTKNGMISVIIHEVGHNFFPMIINSDERQWTWMDEGLNSFVQYLTEQEWDPGYNSRRGPAHKIVDYMKGDPAGMVPIMTNSESILQFGNNAYGKPATALNILRETVMGRELFDFAFKTYCERWAFKHPTPADFFRTMEDASAVDLDWFWRGWFYTTDHVDISLESVKWYRMNTYDPDREMAWEKERDLSQPEYIGTRRNRESGRKTMVETNPDTRDFYNNRDPYEVLELDREDYRRLVNSLGPEERELLQDNYQYYELGFSNRGGLIMPVILLFEFEDGSTEEVRLPAEIWLRSEDAFTKVFFFEKKVISVSIDPHLETADTDTYNNHWPRRVEQDRFELFRERQRGRGENPMQRSRRNANRGGGSE